MPASAVTKAAKAGRRQAGQSGGAKGGHREQTRARSTRALSLASEASPRRTQKERREQAEQAMLLAALEIIVERGVDEFTLAEVGERAGYSRALPAHYFVSKEAAVLKLGEFVVSRYLQNVQRDVPGDESLDDFLERIAHYFDDGRKDIRVLRAFHIIFSTAPAKPEIARALVRLTDETKKTFVRFLRSGIARGEVRADLQPEVEAVWILAALRGIMAQWVVAPEKTPLTKVRDAFLLTLRRALQA